MLKDSAYLQAVYQNIVIFDGAMGTNLQKMGLSAEDFGGAPYEGCNEALVLTKPSAVANVHTSFLQAGADVIETDSFTASRLKLDEYGLSAKTYEINFAAAKLARELADRFATIDKPRFVAGSIGPTGMLPSGSDPTLSAITYRELVDIFQEQAHALIEGGADVLLIETSQDILEVRAAITGIRQAMAALRVWRPIQAQVTLDTSGRMLLGTDISAAMTILMHMGADVIGMNCSTGPEHMREPARFLSDNCPIPISTIPNAGLPLNVNGRAVYPLEPEPMARELQDFVAEYGVNIIGGCCGTSPEHLAAICDAVWSLPDNIRSAPVRRIHPNDSAAGGAASLDSVAGGIRAVSLRQEPKPMIVGERVNTQGSRKIKDAVLRDDYDTLVTVARDQIEWGAHTLDVCLALTERADEAEQMKRAVKALSLGVEAPLVIDSTEANVIRAALETYPGRAIVNSINMENGRQRIESVLPLIKEHGAAVIALTIDEDGMAKTAERKFAIAKRIYDIATAEYDLPPGALIFDTLTFPLTTGQEDLRDSAKETLQAIRMIKERLPEALTILGVSNCSFGVGTHARAVLNSVFLYHAVEAGLDLAIVNPTHITPYAEIDAEQRALCEQLLLNSDIDALPRFIAYYEEHGRAKKKTEERIDPTAEMTADEKIHYMILQRKKDGIERLIDTAVQNRLPAEIATASAEELKAAKSAAAVDTLNNVLLPAMKDVGDRFGAGELILPFVLQSAEVMKKAVTHLEQYLERIEGYTKGKVILATVFGDVHDIGKNLVNTILSNNGYTVYDLGKQTPINTIIDKAIEVQADAIGLSALLVSTSKQMALCVQELDKRNLRFPVIVGGAAINRAFGRRILWVGDEQDAQRHVYDPGVFYARDAFEGLSLMDQIVRADSYESLRQTIVQESLASEQRTEALRQKIPQETQKNAPVRRAAETIPTPPFLGPRVLGSIAIEDIVPFLDRNALFRGRWGAKAHGAEYDRIVAAEFEPRLAEMIRQARINRIVSPRAIYGYFPCWAADEDLIILDPKDTTREAQRFQFPRQPDGERLCLTDYFVTQSESKTPDIAAFQVVTMGKRASEYIDRMQQDGNFSESFFWYGFTVQMAEALAEYINARVRSELGGKPDDESFCRRYSWGYPAIPDLDDHRKLFALMPIEDSIGVALTDGCQLNPEQSTAAFITHNRAAVYFSVRK